MYYYYYYHYYYYYYYYCRLGWKSLLNGCIWPITATLHMNKG